MLTSEVQKSLFLMTLLNIFHMTSSVSLVFILIFHYYSLFRAYLILPSVSSFNCFRDGDKLSRRCWSNANNVNLVRLYEFRSAVRASEDDDSEDQSISMMKGLRKFYDGLFFYGISKWKGKSKKFRRISPKNVGFRSLFYTPSELIALELEKSEDQDKRNQVESTKPLSTPERIQKILKILENLEGDLEIIEATLATISDDGSGDQYSDKEDLERERDRLLQTISSLKIEYVNLVAESS